MPYHAVQPEQLSLRDVLAKDRTVLANERTLLAYMRTGLMLIVSGVSLHELSSAKGWWAPIVEVGLGALGVVLLLLGVIRFVRLRRALRHISERSAQAGQGG